VCNTNGCRSVWFQCRNAWARGAGKCTQEEEEEEGEGEEEEEEEEERRRGAFLQAAFISLVAAAAGRVVLAAVCHWSINHGASRKKANAMKRTGGRCTRDLRE